MCLEQLLFSYRPALQPLAPTVLAPLFESVAAIHRTTEELLGRLEHILEGFVLRDAGTAAAPTVDAAGAADAAVAERELWAAAALAEAFTPHVSGGGGDTRAADGASAVRASPAAMRRQLEQHPLSRYRAFVNRFDASLLALSSLGGVSAFHNRVRQVSSTLHSSHTLNDLLITPIQRPPRYLMLLERARDAFGKTGAMASAWSALDGASALVRAVVSSLNEAKRESDAFHQVGDQSVPSPPRPHYLTRSFSPTTSPNPSRPPPHSSLLARPTPL